jgi:hypothetical protein
MCSNTAQLSKAVPELSRIFVKSGHEKFNTLLSELEKLSDFDNLQRVILNWTERETN